MTYEKVKNLKAEEFKRLCGVQKETFNHMVKIVKNSLLLKKKTGRPSKLSIEDQLLMTLEYLREYRTYFHIGQSWGVNESTAYRITRKIENILIKSKELALPGKKKLTQSEHMIEIIVVDVTETPIDKPKKNRETTKRGKKKRHTIKSQVIVNQITAEIICTGYCKGKEHDFRFFKRSRIALTEDTKCLGDKGYQGLQKIHKNSQTPIKKPKGKELSKEQKKSNKELASKRIIVEHVNRYLKIFRILSERYRNRPKVDLD